MTSQDLRDDHEGDDGQLPKASKKAARRGTTLSALMSFAKFYIYVGAIHGGWVFLLLNLRQGCGWPGSECIPIVTQLVTGTIAVGRGIFWLPEVTIAILRGDFIDWLLLQNLYNPAVGALEQILLHAIGLK